MTNLEKHNYCVDLYSNYLKVHGIGHEFNEESSTSDLILNNDDTQIKILSNFSRSQNIKVSNDFKTQHGVLYIIMTPTDKNNVGFICVDGSKDEIDDSLKTFKTAHSPKNINTKNLKRHSIKKLLNS